MGLRNVVKNSAFIFGANIIQKISALLIAVYVVRLVDPSDYGLYAIAFSLVSCLILFTDFGTKTVMIISASSAKDERAKAAHFRTNLRIRFLLALAISLLLFLFSGLVSSLFGKPDLAPFLQVGAGLLFLMALCDFFESVFYSHTNMLPRFAGKLFSEPLKVLLFFLAVSASLGALSFLWIQIALLFVVLVFYFIYSRLNYRFVFEEKEEIDAWSILDQSKHYVFLLISWTVLTFTDQAAIALFLPASASAFYYVAVGWAFLVLIVLPFIDLVFPLLSRKKDFPLSDFNAISSKMFSLVMFLAIPAALGFFILSPSILKIVYSSSAYGNPETISTMLVLVCAAFVSVLSGFWMNALFIRVGAKTLSRAMIAVILVNAVLDILLIPLWGISGCAASTLISYLLMMGFVFWECRQKGICFAKEHRSALLISAISGLVMAAALVFAFPPPAHLEEIALAVFFGMLVYFASHFILSRGKTPVSKEELLQIFRLK